MAITVSRRQFVGGLAATIGAFGPLHGEARTVTRGQAPAATPRRRRMTIEEYDAAAKLAFNENPDGPSQSVLKAMTSAHRFCGRYGYPDADILDTIAAHHGVTRDNVILGAGSSEILEVAGRTFLPGGRKVVGVQPTFADVYEYASGVRAESIILPLRDDYTQDRRRARRCRAHLLEGLRAGRDAARLRHRTCVAHQADAAAHDRQHQRAGEVGRRRRAEGHGRNGAHARRDARAAEEDHGRTRDARLHGAAVGDELFMVHLRCDVGPVIEAFRSPGILVGRPSRR